MTKKKKCSRLVIKSPFWYWDIIKTKIWINWSKNCEKKEAPKAQYGSLQQWDIACDEKTLLRQPSISAKIGENIVSW